MTDTDGSSSPRPIRRLVGEIVDDPRASAFGSGVPAAPSSGFPSADWADSFGDRFGNGTSPGARITPQQPQDPALSYSRMLRQYLSEQAAGPAQALASSSGVNALNPFQPAPSLLAQPDYSVASSADNSRAPMFDPTNPRPLFAPSNYYAAPGNDSIQRWIASLAGADPDDPDRPSTLFSQLYQR